MVTLCKYYSPSLQKEAKSAIRLENLSKIGKIEGLF